MSTGDARIKLAAVQVQSQPGQTEANLAHATPFIEQAAAQPWHGG
jgi:predicted amidohydrolase